MGAHIACVLGDGRHRYWALRCRTHWDGNLTVGAWCVPCWAAGGTLDIEPLHPLGWEGPLCDGGGRLSRVCTCVYTMLRNGQHIWRRQWRWG